MPVRSENTMAEGLQKILSDISQLKITPDADLQFLIVMETAILDKLKKSASDALQTGNSGNGVPNPQQLQGAMGGMGGPPGMPPGMPPGAGMQGPPPAQTLPGSGMPNPDELRRILSQ